MAPQDNRQSEDPDIRDEDYFRIATNLLRDHGVIPSTAVGRTLLMIHDSERAARAFRHLLEQVPSIHPEQYIVVGNLAYAMSQLGEFDQAVRLLLQIEERSRSGKSEGGAHFFVWHMLALAHAYHMLGDSESAEHWLARARADSMYSADLEWYRRLYPELRDRLTDK